MSNAPEAPTPPAAVWHCLVEPHTGLLKTPADDQPLFKVMTVGNLLRSIDGSYLHFNRVDVYSDSPIADPHDGAQLPADFRGNEAARFAKAPGFSAADYYARCRSRTYACCFGLENNAHLWEHYGNGDERGKVWVELSFGKLRRMLNGAVASATGLLLEDGPIFPQVMDINHGLVAYVDRDSHRANGDRLPNPIAYSYLKDKRFGEENELRITLSASGAYAAYGFADGRRLDFPPGLQMPFDFRRAMDGLAITRILFDPSRDLSAVLSDIEQRGIRPSLEA